MYIQHEGFLGLFEMSCCRVCTPAQLRVRAKAHSAKAHSATTGRSFAEPFVKVSTDSNNQYSLLAYQVISCPAMCCCSSMACHTVGV